MPATKIEKLQEVLANQKAALQAITNRNNALVANIADLRQSINTGESQLRDLLAAEAAKLKEAAEITAAL